LENGEGNNVRKRFADLVAAGKLPLVDYSEAKMGIPEMANYKFQIDMDGWANTWDGLLWKMAAGSAVLKVDGGWEQMYYKWLKPGVHYIPVKEDMSNLAEKLQWCVEHDVECKKIGEAAREFVRGLTLERLTAETLEAVKPAL
jgi:hypothetical protein